MFLPQPSMDSAREVSLERVEPGGGSFCQEGLFRCLPYNYISEKCGYKFQRHGHKYDGTGLYHTIAG